MPELEDVSVPLGEHRQERFQPVGIGFDMRRKLEQYGTELAAKRTQPRVHELERALARLAKSLPVRDVLRRFPRKLEAVRCLVPPLADGFESRSAIERAIDLRTGKLGSIPAEPALSGNIGWIERPPPIVVCPARRPDPDLAEGRSLS